MAFRPQESEVNDLNNPCENSEQKPSIPLSVYANKLEEKVKKRYVEKISAIGIDPVLIEGKNFEPDCLPPVESTDLLFQLVLETSYYTKQQFKAFRSLQAYNPMANFMKNSFTYSGAVLWNSLPCHVREAESLSQFKRLVNVHF